jgi:V8-like Glu-specific endopeptidase
MNTQIRTILSAVLLSAACDPEHESEAGSRDSGLVDLVTDEDRAMAEAIIDLSDLSGPEIDDERKLLPVPTVAIDLYSDGQLAVPLHERTVFGPDGRFIFYDHKFPFSTVGKIETAGGSCTGTLVGPRHVLTASHCMEWNPDNSVGWVRFRPSLYNSEQPFGEAWASVTYHYRKVDTDGDGLVSSDETAFDFVVLVLDRYIGNSAGWMGSKTYSNSWNGGAYWANIGYPADLGGTFRPVFQSPCSVSSMVEHCWSSWCSLQLKTQCDTNGGQSGGPLYGTWSGSPSVIGVVSAGNQSFNSFAGGSLIPTLINTARNQHP